MTGNASSSETRALQRKLNLEGFGPIAEDGVFGPQTQAALEQRELALAEMPPPPKPWWASRAMLGALATILVSVLGLAKHGVTAETLTELLVQATTLLAGILALVGTLKRTRPIDRRLLPERQRLRASAKLPPDLSSGRGRAGSGEPGKPGPFGY